MGTNTLPEKPAKHFILDVLRPNWDPSNVRGYDVSQSTITADDYLADATTLENVGAIYPSLVVSASQPGPTGGETTYDFLTDKGPGQNRQPSLLATARAEGGIDYVGDSASYSATDAETIVEEIITEVEEICFDNPLGASSDFSFVGVQRPSDAPNDNDPSEGRTVYQAQAEIRVGHIRDPK